MKLIIKKSPLIPLFQIGSRRFYHFSNSIKSFSLGRAYTIKSPFSPACRQAGEKGGQWEFEKLELKILHILLVLAFLSIGCASQANKKKEMLHQAIQSYLGTPYQWGNSSQKGIDCSGFTQEVYKKSGITLPRTAREQYDTGKKVDKDDLEYGDLVFFNTKPLIFLSSCFFPCILFNMEVPSVYGITHVGIYIEDDKFVHSSASRGVIFENLNSSYWKKRFVGARRLLD